MQVIAHNGPNWTPGSLAVQACSGQIAVAVRNTVLFYDFNGRYTGEIRAVGRGRVTALAFCTAPALTHLLAVGTSEGFVRIFDAQTRRVFRRVREPTQGKRREAGVFAVRFVHRFPNVLLVLTEPNRMCCWRYEDPQIARCVVDMELQVQELNSVECVPGSSSLVLVGGLSKDGLRVGIVMVVDLSGKHPPSIFYRGFVIYDLVTRAEDNGSGANEILLVMASAARRRPLMYKSLDGMTWTLVTERVANNGSIATGPSSSTGGATYAGNKDNPAEYRCAATWCGPRELMVSDPKGTVIHWHMDDDDCLIERSERQSAHIRQVFAMKALGTKNEFVSISMDRTIAAWVLSDIASNETKMLLKWRTFKTTGHVKALSVTQPSRSEQKLVTGTEQRLSTSSVVFFATSDTITCIGSGENDAYFMIGEVCPLGPPSRKRKRESLLILSPCVIDKKSVSPDAVQTANLTLFATHGSGSKRLGLIRLVDGELEFVCSSKQKPQNGSKQHQFIMFSARAYTAAISISSNGEAQKQILPQSRDCWKEARKTSSLLSDGSFAASFGETTPSASAACVLQQHDRDEYLLCIGYEDGSLAVFTPSGKRVVGPVGTGLSQITCITYRSDCSVIAVCDRNGLVVTSSLDISQHEYEDAKREQVLEIKRHEGLEEAIRHMTWSKSVPQSDSRSSEANVYLLAITERGSMYAWIYQEDCTLLLRAELKAHNGAVNSSAWESDKCLLSAGEDGTIRKWDLEKQPWPRTTVKKNTIP